MALVRRLIDALGEAEALETPAARVGHVVRPLTDPRPVKNALSGGWLGHRLHPLLTDVVLGTWLSAGVLDLLGGREGRPGADLLLGAGVASAVPTAASGLSDYADLYDHGRRVAFVHGLGTNVATVLQIASLLARRRGRRGLGVALSLGALGTVGAASYLGGHLSYVLGIGVDHSAFEEGPKDWVRVGIADEFGSRPRVVRAGEHEVLLARVDGRLVGLGNRCSHAGWPIADGPVDDGCITCPHHGSVFRLADGSVVRGPAASPQLRYHVRVRAGVVEVRGSR